MSLPAAGCGVLLLLLHSAVSQQFVFRRLPIPEWTHFTVVSAANQQPWQWVTPSMLFNRPTQRVTGNETVPTSGNFLLADDAIATLESPGYPNVYPGRIWTSWKFMTDQPDTELSLSCSEFGLVPGDYLGVHAPGRYHQVSAGALSADVTAREFIMVELLSEEAGGGRLRCHVQARPIGHVGLNHRLCGLTEQDVRIVGGEEAPKNAYPWLTALTESDDEAPFCGGSIISENLIVTATHCVYRRDPEDIDVLVRKHQRGVDADEVRLKLSRIITHGDYDQGTMDNDIALLVVNGSMRDLILNEDGRVRPICLPEPCSDDSDDDDDDGGDDDEGDGETQEAPLSCLAGRQARVAGWGILRSFGSETAHQKLTPDTVMHVTVPIIDNDQCIADYKKRGLKITNNMICAGLTDGGKDSCQGDSGGPLMIRERDNKFVLAGIVSFGIGCGWAHYPGVYSRVSELACWIKEGRKKCERAPGER